MILVYTTCFKLDVVMFDNITLNIKINFNGYKIASTEKRLNLKRINHDIPIVSALTTWEHQVPERIRGVADSNWVPAEETLKVQSLFGFATK